MFRDGSTYKREDVRTHKHTNTHTYTEKAISQFLWLLRCISASASQFRRVKKERKKNAAIATIQQKMTQQNVNRIICVCARGDWIDQLLQIKRHFNCKSIYFHFFYSILPKKTSYRYSTIFFFFWKESQLKNKSNTKFIANTRERLVRGTGHTTIVVKIEHMVSITLSGRPRFQLSFDSIYLRVFYGADAIFEQKKTRHQHRTQPQSLCRVMNRRKDSKRIKSNEPKEFPCI